MADTSLICAACGTKVTVSEYVTDPVFCPQCGKALEKNEAHTDRARPKLASMQSRASLVSPAIPPELPSAAAVTPAVPNSRRQKHREDGRVRVGRRLRLQAFFSWILFLVLLGLLLDWQWKGQTDERLLQSYLETRWGLVAVAWLIVLVRAFLDTWIQGAFCLMIPPYVVYYALNRMDEFYLRAIFFAVFLALAAEYYFLPSQTLVGIVQVRLAGFADSVHHLIQNASAMSGKY